MGLKSYLEAKKIVDKAQAIASDPTPIRDTRLGVHLAGDHVRMIQNQINRKMPYRKDDRKRGHMFIRLSNDTFIWTSGNEYFNNINEKKVGNKPGEMSQEEYEEIWNSESLTELEKYIKLGKALTPELWMTHVKLMKETHPNEYLNGELGSPALMTLKQLGKKKWSYLIKNGAEKEFNYWVINHHPPTYLRQSGRMQSGLGAYWELIKTTRHLIEFRNKTKLPVCFGEIGGGQYHYSLDPMSVKLLWTLVSEVFQERLACALVYDSDLVRRIGGLQIF